MNESDHDILLDIRGCVRAMQDKLTALDTKTAELETRVRTLEEFRAFVRGYGAPFMVGIMVLGSCLSGIIPLLFRLR